MSNATLVVMAAGIGSRFGGGIKQLEPVGPNGEIIIDYSIHDALEAGFNKIVFVIRKDLEKDFDEIIGQRIKKKVNVEYVFQEISNIPSNFYETFKDRAKPWGTGQAILACKDVVHEPFLVINADDYYGKEAYHKAYDYLVNNNDETSMCMVGFVLKNTLSLNGGVTRGVCHVKDNKLNNIVETKNIEYIDGKAVTNGTELDLDSVVSMNMWGLSPMIFDVLDKGFIDFLKNLDKDDLKSEYLLPTIIDNLLHDGRIEVNVLQTKDSWFGVTYKEDKEYVKENIQRLIKEKVYPEKI